MKILKYFILIICFSCLSTQVFAEKLPVCKNGGENSKINPLYCCKNGYTLGFYHDIKGNATEDYFTYAPQICGCPDNGIVSDNTCKKNGYEYHNYVISPYDFIKFPNMKKGEYSAIALPDEVPVICPKGTENRKNHCCKNGYSLGGIIFNYDPKNCGCPDNGVYDGFGGCVLDNTWVYNMRDSKYNRLLPSQYECPKGTKKVTFNSFKYCCKNGFSYDEKSETWTKFEVACGCPEEGKAAIKLLGTNIGCCKNGYKYNTNTKQYDIKDDFFCPVTLSQKVNSKIKNFIESVKLIILLPIYLGQNLH